jgi:hypothetical protein
MPRTVHDDHTRGTITFKSGVEDGTSTLSASSGDLLLWLYSRVEIVGDPRTTMLGQRLRALSFTN